MNICLAVPVLADTMGMASIIHRRQEGAERGGRWGKRTGKEGKTKAVGVLRWPPLFWLLTYGQGVKSKSQLEIKTRK